MRRGAYTRGGWGVLSAFAAGLAALAAAGLFGACADSDVIPSPPGSGGAGGAGGAGDAGGAGGAASSSSSGGAGGSTMKCGSDADCVGNPVGAVCNPTTSACVECLPTSDACPPASYCDPATNTCAAGCDADADCASPEAPLCKVSAHLCVACLSDAECALGTLCIGDACVPGCSPTQACPVGLSCCGSICVDVTTDADHCGDCLNPCAPPPNAAAICQAGACGMGACDAAWADCDINALNGCEHNALQDGACACKPGESKACYSGPAGTLGVGPCAAGTTVCDASGLAWSPCAGQVLPSTELCANTIDEDCDGVVDNVIDNDGDGFTACDGDCCESAQGACQAPALVNPGAFEVVGNGVDDDCDPLTSDAAPPAACSALEDFTAVTALDVAKAMDICQTTVVAPPLPQKKWGLITYQQLLANGSAPSVAQLGDIQNYQTAILTAYGTGGVVPKRGPTMAGLSTGRMRDQGDAGYVDPNGGTDFAWDSAPPAAYLAEHGGQLPSSLGCSGSCPAGAGANDSVNVRFKLRTPTNANSVSYDFRFVSAEYYLWTCNAFNDFYLALLQTGAPGLPSDKNISFDALGNPLSVNNSFFDVCKAKGCYDCPGGVGELAGTGMQLNNTGGATKWLTTDAPVVPGEIIQLELMIFDVSDNVLDSIALLDNFRWNQGSTAVITHE